LSRLFRGKFLATLADLYTRGQLTLAGNLQDLAEPGPFALWIGQLRETEWVVYAKPPFGGPQQVLKYLARYTHRVAISNQRLESMDNEKVAFQWKDYADSNTSKVMTINGVEFARRFLQHVLPTGFVRIRHFGFLANRCRDEKLPRCRALLRAHPVPSVEPPDELPIEATTTSRTVEGDECAELKSQRCCPVCRVGRMIVLEVIPRLLMPSPICSPRATDTS